MGKNTHNHKKDTHGKHDHQHAGHSHHNHGDEHGHDDGHNDNHRHYNTIFEKSAVNFRSYIRKGDMFGFEV